MSTRKIKDAKDLVTNELIYFKGHAKATYMSDGRNVEEAIHQIGTSGGGGGITTETDPIFSASPAASITEKKKTEWDNKVDKVSGKQLSTEDFTTILKTKLEGLSNYDDTELSNALSTLRSDFDKLVSGDTTDAIKTFNEVIAFLNGVQDTQDLSSIIASIEQQIASKMDKVTLAKVATSGSYNDLSNKPTIPAAVTETTVKGWGFTKNTGTYSKPSGGIPKTDLAPAVQASLDSVESKQDKPIVFDAVAIGYNVNVAETEITAEQIQTATGMTSEELYDAVIAGRKVTLSLGEVYGSYELLAIQDFNDFVYLIFGSFSVIFAVIIARGLGGSIQQSAPLDDYYTKNDVDEKIASAITSTLNTAV